MAEVKQSTKDYSSLFNDNAEVDLKTGEIKINDTAFAAALEKGGVSKEDYQKVTELNSNIAAGFGLFVGEKGNEIFKKNKDATNVSAVLPTVGRDSFKASYDRTAQFTNPQTKEKVTQYGILNVQHNVVGTRKGQYGAVKQLLKVQAKEVYGEK